MGVHTEKVLGFGSFFGYVFIPVVTFLAIGFFALVLRWATTPARRAARANFGLLVPLARFDRPADAELLAHKLRTKGIKASTGRDGLRHCVLVWRVQEPLAKILVSQLRGEETTP